MDTVTYIIGQMLGIVAVVLGFICFQMKSSRGILIFQIIVAFVFSAHYLLINAFTAMALNLLGAIQCIFYYFRDKRGSKSLAEPVVFTVMMLIVGFVTWEGWYSAFIVLGLVVNAISLAVFDAQKIRYSMFIKSPACLLYNILVLSGGGIIYECAVLASSIIGVLRNRSEKKSVSVEVPHID